MYIHSYQINNVLNVYHKQLSQKSGSTNNRPVSLQRLKDQVVLSAESQRRSIIDQVSAEIVDRMARNGPQTQFGQTLDTTLDELKSAESSLPLEKRGGFTFSLIDENNQKRTHTLAIEEFRPLITGENEPTVEVEP